MQSENIFTPIYVVCEKIYRPKECIQEFWYFVTVGVGPERPEATRPGLGHMCWMINFFFIYHFQVFSNIPFLSLTGGPEDVTIVSDQSTVGWYIRPHRSGLGDWHGSNGVLRREY